MNKIWRVMATVLKFCSSQTAKDYNGNGLVSLAEMDGCVTEQFKELNNKPALMLLGCGGATLELRRAYKATLRNPDGYVHKNLGFAMLYT